jgi:hypothetical protein
LILQVPARKPGQLFSARYRLIPTLAGKLNASASSIEAGGLHQDLAPVRWTVVAAAR